LLPAGKSLEKKGGSSRETSLHTLKREEVNRGQGLDVIRKKEGERTEERGPGAEVGAKTARGGRRVLSVFVYQ